MKRITSAGVVLAAVLLLGSCGGNSTLDDTEAARLFGGADDQLQGDMGLDALAFANVITQVGNYAEIYERNLGPDTPFDLPRGLNELWTQGGLLYPPPAR